MQARSGYLRVAHFRVTGNYEFYRAVSPDPACVRVRMRTGSYDAAFFDAPANPCGLLIITHRSPRPISNTWPTVCDEVFSHLFPIDSVSITLIGAVDHVNTHGARRVIRYNREMTVVSNQSHDEFVAENRRRDDIRRQRRAARRAAPLRTTVNDGPTPAA